jgi:hypothetical protein
VAVGRGGAGDPDGAEGWSVEIDGRTKRPARRASSTAAAVSLSQRGPDPRDIEITRILRPGGRRRLSSRTRRMAMAWCWPACMARGTAENQLPLGWFFQIAPRPTKYKSASGATPTVRPTAIDATAVP